MPTISVDKLDLFERLGKTYTPKDFEDLCFEFGIELDDDTTEEAAATGGRAELKIEVPANRYDMLCIEGIAQALNEFLGNTTNPEFKLVPGATEFTLTVDESTAAVRPYAAGAILRNITFTQSSYESFISLQDKLHVNLCRNRTLVAMGTHDLDKLTGPITYEALPPKEFKFTPLNQTKEMTGEELMAFYEKDKNLGKYLHIIRDLPVYPVMLDANRKVASMPPIINSDLSKITLDTRNVFIDITATDRTKAEVVVNTLVSMFSRYCDEPFTVEPVRVISPHNGESRITPNIAPRTMTAEIDYINSCLGLELSAEAICSLLVKMALKAQPSAVDANLIDVSIPCTRPDILHQCDIMEDAAIAYGYANMTASKTPSSSLVAAPLPINKVADILRIASAQSGYIEVMPLTLCSHDENFAHLKQVDDNTKAVKLANPKSLEYQVVRTTLLPGLLKTVKENRKHSLPIRVFEAGDVVLKDLSLERGAFNQRHWCALHVGKTSGFEYVQGLLGKIMQTIQASWIAQPETGKARGYWIEQEDFPTFFEGRGARVMFRAEEGAEAVRIGEIGVLHPEVLLNFDIPYAAASVEINAEVFL